MELAGMVGTRLLVWSDSGEVTVITDFDSVCPRTSAQ